MADVLRWAIAIELIGLAFLPLTAWMLPRLPDRGYACAQVLGLILVTYGTWLAGSAFPVARSPAIPFAVVVLAAAVGWTCWRKETLAGLHEARRLVAVETLLFIVGLVLLSGLRVQVFHSGIAHTEQYMDMAFLNASYRAASYPPQDPWMSGHPINYYYFGYLMFATLAKLSGVAPSTAYNLALSAVFAWTTSIAYALGHALTRRLTWSFAAPLFVAVFGNWHAALWQIPHSGCVGAASPDFWRWLWDSTRVIGGHFTLLDWSCGHPAQPLLDYTINEYPLFSFVLGDLHPHVMALPVALLALCIGYNVLRGHAAPALRVDWTIISRLAVGAIAVGALFTINSWDFPTYLLVVSACIAVNAYLVDATPQWWKTPLVAVALLALASLLLFAPFYAHFRSLAHGVGRVTTPSDIYEFVQVLGFPLLTCGLLLGCLSLLLRPIDTEEEVAEGAGQSARPFDLADQSGVHLPGFGLLAGFLGLAVFGAWLHQWVLLLLLTVGCASLILLGRVLNTEEPNRADAAALVLVAVACLVLAVTEVLYVGDTFDGSAMYRMNTVFKFYYQAWVLLGIAGAYGVYRASTILRNLYGRTFAAAGLLLVVLGALGSAVYTAQIPAYAVEPHDVKSLDGMAWLKQDHSTDYAAIRWLSAHVTGNPTVLEAVGQDYDASVARVSTFSGLPTVMGWTGHEGQWRPGDPDIGRRASDVRTMYTTSSIATAERLLRRYHVQYVFIGDAERQAYAGGSSRSAGLAKFSRFMKLAYDQGETRVYTW